MLRSTIFGTWAALGLLLATGGGCAYLQQHCECIRSPMLKWAVGCPDSGKCQSCKEDAPAQCGCRPCRCCQMTCGDDSCSPKACGRNCGCGLSEGGAKVASPVPAVPDRRPAPALQPSEKAKSVEPTMPWPGEIPATKPKTMPAAPAKKAVREPDETPSEPAAPQPLPKVLPPLNKPETGEDGLVPLAPSSGDERPIGPEKTKKAAPVEKDASLLKRLTGSLSSEVVGCMASMPGEGAEPPSHPSSPLRPVASSVYRSDFGEVRVTAIDAQGAALSEVSPAGNPLR